VTGARTIEVTPKDGQPWRVTDRVSAKAGEINKAPELARGVDSETTTTSLDGAEFHNDIRKVSPAARHVIRQLEKQGWVRVDQIALDDAVVISKWFGKEIGVVQSPYGRLRIILGTRNGILSKDVRAGEVFVLHTHPTMVSKKGHFTLDLATAGKHVEAVIDWSGNVTYYSKSGIKNPISAGGTVEPLLDYHASFLDGAGNVIGFARVDLLEVPGGKVNVKVRE
jgi:hypothetical protein